MTSTRCALDAFTGKKHGSVFTWRLSVLFVSIAGEGTNSRGPFSIQASFRERPWLRPIFLSADRVENYSTSNAGHNLCADIFREREQQSNL